MRSKKRNRNTNLNDNSQFNHYYISSAKNCFKSMTEPVLTILKISLCFDFLFWFVCVHFIFFGGNYATDGLIVDAQYSTSWNEPFWNSWRFPATSPASPSFRLWSDWGTPPTTKATALHHLVVSCLLPLKTDFRKIKDGPLVGCDLLVHFRVCWKIPIEISGSFSNAATNIFQDKHDRWARRHFRSDTRRYII